MIVPAYAYTFDGKRLGKGKGYYDRFFNSHKQYFKMLPKLVGLAFKQQVVGDIPIEKHDIPVNIVVTP